MAEKRCSICRRPPNEVNVLIGDPNGPLICDRCTTTAWSTLTETQNKNKPKVEEKPLPKPRELYSQLNEHVISQVKAKQDVSVAIYNHYKRRDAIRRGLKYECEIQKSNILLLGPSGTGKTEIARSVSKSLGVPFFNADATKMTAAGYVGQDVESMIQGVLQDADGDVARAEWGICFLDECDKISRKSGKDGSHYRDVGGEAVQQALLKMVEGTKVVIPKGLNRMVSTGQQEHDTVDTKNILFIFAGSFAGIEDVVRKRLNKDVRLGFGSGTKKELNLTEVYNSVVEEDILEFGIIPELLGRLPIITSTLPLTDDEMVQVLTQPKNAIIKQFKALWDMDSIDLQFDEGALRAIAQEAQKRPTGARALRSILEKILRPYSFDYPSEEDIVAVRITEEVVQGKGEATVVTGDRRKKAEPPPAAAAQS